MPEEKKSVFQVIIHSFFVVPFIIAIFGVLIFLMARVLTLEPSTAHDYLEDVKIGGSTKRWQGAFELSKILSNPNSNPTDDRFVNDLISTYKYSENEKDNRIQIYLALAMGRTRDERYSDILERSLNNEDEEILSAVIFSLGLIANQHSLEKLLILYNHSSARVRHQLVVALGNYNNNQSRKILYESLNDVEPNVRWDAAISLAKQKDNKGRRIILDLMDRKYLDSFPNIDPIEQNQAMMTAITVSKQILDNEIKEMLIELMDNDINIKIRQAARNALQ